MEKVKLGVDVSKSTLDCYDSSTKSYTQILNTTGAIKDYLLSYSQEEVALVVEPTGSYHSKFCELASALGYQVLMANPQQSSSYMKVLKMSNKTDQAAAKSLALLASHVDLPEYQSGTEKRKQLRMVYNGLKKYYQSIQNQLESLAQYLAPAALAKTSLEAVSTSIKAQLEKVASRLHKLDTKSEKRFYKLATSVVGIGEHSAQGLLHYTNGLQDFNNSSQLVKYMGIAPHQHFSGSSVHRKGRIGKNGPSTLRACLYNAAKSAKRFNHACKALYERMRSNGKPHKVAMIAIVRKLLRQVFAVVKSGKTFDNERFNTESQLKTIQAK